MAEGRSHLRLGARIGRGGMAEVFAGKLVGVAGFEKEVAVKRVLPKYAGDPAFLSRFLDEARLAARLSHPNIVQIFELGQDAGDHYIVMEAVRGVTLRMCLMALAERGEKMPPAIALHVAQGLCAGLAYAHELCGADGAPLGIVHRDVSPQNVLLGFEGAVKLIDFGIARARDNAAFTQVGRVVGKPRFMSPEQILGDNVDARADVFALGLVLFEMLAGRGPFDDDKDPAEAIVEGRGRRLGDLEPSLEKDIVDVVKRATARRAADRFAGARAFGGALLSVSQDRTRTGPHDLEGLLLRLFPEPRAPWPVESPRADSAEHTATVDVPLLREITLDSDSGDTLRDMVPLGAGPGAAAPAGTASPRALERTDTLPRARRAARGRAAVAAVVVVAAALVVLAALRPRASWLAVADAGPTGAIVAAGANVATNADAGAPTDAGATQAAPTATAALPGDAGAMDFGLVVVDAGARHAKKRMGRLVVETRPWSEVRLGGKLLGITPLAVAVPVGKHALRLVNPPTKLTRTVSVTVSEDKPAVLRVDLRSP